jgi:hypothetical protein
VLTSWTTRMSSMGWGRGMRVLVALQAAAMVGSAILRRRPQLGQAKMVPLGMRATSVLTGSPFLVGSARRVAGVGRAD